MLISGVFVIVAAILIGLHRHDMLNQFVRFAEQQNATLAQSFVNTIWPTFSEHVYGASNLPGQTLKAHPKTLELDAVLSTLTAGLPIFKVKIYDLNTLTVYSSDEQEIGKRTVDNAGYSAALRGTPASKLTYSGSLTAFSHLAEQRDLVESYIPITDASGKTQGVFELYTDVTPLLKEVKQHSVTLAIRSVAAFILLYLALFLLIRRAQATIQTQYDDIAEKKNALEHEVHERKLAEEALQKAHDKLEERVADRTRELTQEISERKQAEENLRKLSVAVEQSPAMTIITDASGAIEYVNPRFTQVTGYELNAVAGRNPRLLQSGNTPPEVYAQLWRTITAGEEWRGELQNKKDNGDLFWTSTAISPIKDQDGNITHYLGVSEDITTRKNIEEEIRAHRNHLAHVGRVSIIGEMATSLAHELNQPLTVISGSAQLALSTLEDSDPSGTVQREALRQIAGQAHRAEQIVRRVRRFIKKNDSELRLTDVNTIVRGSVNLMKVDAQEHNVAIKLALAQQLPPVRADRIQIEQVLVNLVHNAVDAMRDTQEVHPKVVTIRTGLRVHDIVEIAVHNPGPPIAAAELEHVFEPFFTKKEQGLGMGLSIARSIVEAHGGHLWGQSTEDAGTTFSFTLPAVSDRHS